MSLQYISDNSDDDLGSELPQWQKDIIDSNLREVADHPERLHPIEELFKELDSEEEKINL